jgi:drug/metabolite transporter (DMT)-like permease
MSRRGWLLFVAMSIIWGTPYLFIRVAVRQIDPATLIFFRTAPATLLLLPLAVHRKALVGLLIRWRWIAVFTVIEFAIPWYFVSRAEIHLTSSLTGLLIASVPLTGAVIYRTLGYEKFDRRRVFGLLVGFAGVAALVGVDVRGAQVGSVLEVLIPAVGYALGPLIIARKLDDLDGIGVVAFSLGMASVLYAPYALTHLPSAVSTSTGVSVICLIVFCTALGFVLFFALTVEVGPARSTVITYVNPAVALLLGVVVLNERITLGMVVGFPMILLGSWLATATTDPVPEPGHSPLTAEPPTG